MSGRRSPSEDANLNAAAAEIQILSGAKVAGPARNLADAVIKVHSAIADGTGVAKAEVDEVDRCRYELIDLFRVDLELE